MQVQIRTAGFPQALALLRGVAAAGRALMGPIVSLTNVEPYASPIETGFFKTGKRAGRRARAAGGAFMYREGLKAMQPKIGPALAVAIPKGPAGVAAAKRQLTGDAVKEVQARTPKRGGGLRAGVRPSGRVGS